MKAIFDVQQLSQFEFGAIIITVLIAGLVFGCLLAYALLRQKNSSNADAADAIKEEFEEYKDKVDSHFNKTSEMFKDVTTQYKKLYDHMAVGAIELSKADTITMPRLEMQESEQTQADADEVAVDDPSADDSADITDKGPEIRPVDDSGKPVEEEEIASDDSLQDDDPDGGIEHKPAKPE